MTMTRLSFAAQNGAVMRLLRRIRRRGADVQHSYESAIHKIAAAGAGDLTPAEL